VKGPFTATIERETPFEIKAEPYTIENK